MQTRNKVLNFSEIDETVIRVGRQLTMYRYGLLLSQLRTILDISISIERNMPVAEQVIQT